MMTSSTENIYGLQGISNIERVLSIVMTQLFSFFNFIENSFN
jgi:hypothetical protein